MIFRNTWQYAYTCIDVNRHINKRKHKNVIKNIQNAGGRVGGGGHFENVFYKTFLCFCLLICLLTSMHVFACCHLLLHIIAYIFILSYPILSYPILFFWKSPPKKWGIYFWGDLLLRNQLLRSGVYDLFHFSVFLSSILCSFFLVKLQRRRGDIVKNGQKLKKGRFSLIKTLPLKCLLLEWNKKREKKVK